MKSKGLCLAACLLLFAGCSDGSSQEQTDTLADVTVNEAVTTSYYETEETIVTEMTTERAETTATEADEDMVRIMGEYYSAETSGYLTVDADRYGTITAEDIEKISRLENLWYIDVINTNDNDLSFLADIKGISHIRFYDVGDNDLSFLLNLTELESTELVNIECDVHSLIDTVKQTSIERLSVRADNFSLKDGETLILELSDCTVLYSDSEGYGFMERNEPENEMYVMASPYVAAFEDEGTRSTVIYIDNDRFEKIKNNSAVLTSYFCNGTDEDIIVDGMELYYNFGRSYEDTQYDMDENHRMSVGFADGGTYLEINQQAGAHEDLCFELTNDMFDYKSARSGMYTAVYYYGDKTYECDFLLKASDSAGLDFLDGEQKQAFAKARSYMREYFSVSHNMSEEYASTHTADEFARQFCDAFTFDYARQLADGYADENGELKAVQGDRGSDITLVDVCFYPMVRTSGEVLINCVTAHYHSDFSSKVWMETSTVHMIMTEDGWRVDDFMLWW